MNVYFSAIDKHGMSNNESELLFLRSQIWSKAEKIHCYFGLKETINNNKLGAYVGKCVGDLNDACLI